MTNQEIFDTVVAHLFAQGRPAILQGYDSSKSPMCAYRQDDLSCAFGCIIPDSVYTPEMEELPAGLVIHHWLPHLKQANPIIESLQMVHDNTTYFVCSTTSSYPKTESTWIDDAGTAFNPPVLRRQLINIGNKFDLDTSRVPNV